MTTIYMWKQMGTQHDRLASLCYFITNTNTYTCILFCIVLPHGTRDSPRTVNNLAKNKLIGIWVLTFHEKNTSTTHSWWYYCLHSCIEIFSSIVCWPMRENSLLFGPEEWMRTMFLFMQTRPQHGFCLKPFFFLCLLWTVLYRYFVQRMGIV